MKNQYTRRDFVRTSALATAAVGSINILNAQSGGKLKVGLVGCGGRGTGALKNFHDAAKLLGMEVEVVAVADAFEDKVQKTLKTFGLDASKAHFGFDAYHKVAASDAEFVLMATPPNFRPIHLEAMVEAGKHCFIEKPVAVDPPGARKVIELGEKAKAKGLAIVAGTQRRYQADYLDAKAKIDAGAIGEIVGGSIAWNMGVLWKVVQASGMSAAEYMARNWLNWTEMSGDHIVEQHVHQLDVANWWMGRPPEMFIGYGGRARRASGGNQFDFFSVDMQYGDGVHIHSQCRQIAGCYNRVGETFRGTEGHTVGVKVTGKDVTIDPAKTEHSAGQVQEHVEMIKSVRGGNPINAARPVSEATLMAIGGRIAAYTGKLVRWVDLTVNEKSEFYSLTLSPAAADFEKGDVELPPEEPAVPGEDKGWKERG